MNPMYGHAWPSCGHARVPACNMFRQIDHKHSKNHALERYQEDNRVQQAYCILSLFQIAVVVVTKQYSCNVANIPCNRVLSARKHLVLIKATNRNLAALVVVNMNRGLSGSY
jgi:hypothetical protein